MARNWTPEEREKQATAMRKWKPWEQSSGPKTNEGKAATAKNALKSGLHSAQMNELKKTLREQEQILKLLTPP